MQRVLKRKAVLDVDDDGAGPLHDEGWKMKLKAMWIVEAEAAVVEVQGDLIFFLLPLSLFGSRREAEADDDVW